MNFTDWRITDVTQLDDNDGVASNSSSRSRSRGGGDVHGNGSWSLSVPDSCCVDLLEQVGCGWSVMNEMESRLNNIHTEARLVCSAYYFLPRVAMQSAVYRKLSNSVCISYSDMFATNRKCKVKY